MSADPLPRVSVIMPAYHQAAHIEAALDSVAAQTYRGPIEILVIDDDSPDDSAQRARRHASSPRVVHQANTGVSGARNHGIRLAQGDYLAFLDSDDQWLPQKLERQIEAMQRLGRPCLSFTRYQRVDAHGEALTRSCEHPSLGLRPSPRQLIAQNFIGTSTVVMHRACVERCGGFPAKSELLRAGQDYALWLRVASLFALVYVPEVLTRYTVHEGNRVGIDPLKHHDGGIHALRDFAAWAPERFAPMAGATLGHVELKRTLKLVKDLVTRRQDYPPGTLKRAPKRLSAPKRA